MPIFFIHTGSFLLFINYFVYTVCYASSGKFEDVDFMVSLGLAQKCMACRFND